MITHHIDTLRGSLSRIRKAALATGDRAAEVDAAEADDQILADAITEIEELRRTLDTRDEELRVFRSSASLASSLIDAPPPEPCGTGAGRRTLQPVNPADFPEAPVEPEDSRPRLPAMPPDGEPDRIKLRALHKIQLFASGADDVDLPPSAARGVFKAINHLALDALVGAP